MAKGENIYKRKDGRWEARYIKERQKDGTIRYGYVYGHSYAEAKEKAENRRLDVLLEERNRAKAEISFEQAAKTWLERKKHRLKQSTWYRYESMICGHLTACFNSMDIRAITLAETERFTRWMMEEQGLSAKTTRDYLVLLNSILSETAGSCSPSFTPPALQYPKETRQEMRVLTDSEQKRLRLYLEEHFSPDNFGILLSLYTGLRIGELCALRWEHVNLEDQILRVEGTLGRIRAEDGTSKTRICVLPPKTDHSARTIPLCSYLLQLIERCPDRDPQHYILTSDSVCMDPRTLQNRFKKIARDCSLGGVHFHTLRHTFATRCVELPVDAKCLFEILGHASVRTTLERYVHTSLSLKRENMKKLDGLNC